MKKLVVFLFTAVLSLGVYAQNQAVDYTVKISVAKSDHSPSYGTIGERDGAYYFVGAHEGDVMEMVGEDQANLKFPADAYQSIKDYLDREVGPEKYGIRSIAYQPTEVRNVYHVAYIAFDGMEERKVSIATMK